MADDIDLELETDAEVEQRKENKRIKDLSEKVRLTAEDRDEKDRLLAKEKAQTESLTKERDFLNSFGDQLGKFPEAASFKDKIKEKVLKGYSVEDATTAVLVSEGKYTPPRVEQPIENIAGGSAPTIHQPTGSKTFSQMSRDEKRAKLIEAEQRGDISVS